MLQVLSCIPGRVLRLRLSLQGAETRLYYILGFWVQKAKQGPFIPCPSHTRVTYQNQAGLREVLININS